MAGVIKIQVATKGGDDTVDIANSDFDLDPITVNAFVDLGAGSDNRFCSNSGDGNDTLVGGDGNDCFNAGPGNDTLYGEQLDGGGSGNDGLRGEDGNDVLKGGKKDDRLGGGNGDDLYDGGVGADEMGFQGGGQGIDTVDYSDHTEAIDVTLADGQPNDGNSDDGPIGARDTILAGVENVIGGSGDDDIDGSSDNNQLNGRGGQDRLSGFSGADTLIGSTGADFMTGGQDTDLAFYADHAAGVNVTIGDGAANDGNSVDGPAGARDNVFSDVENVLGSPGVDS